MNTQIANTTEHQSQVTRSIINDLDAIRAETEVLLSSSEEVSASSAELTRLSNMLDKLVKQYSK
jgi:methyl-accepting chemotaxis protein